MGDKLPFISTNPKVKSISNKLLRYYFGPLWSIYRWISGSKSLPYPIFNMAETRDLFSYPVNHPIDGGVYACCDAEPKLYVPLASFHRYMYEAKMSAFNLLCANLGVRRCSVVYAEENGKEVSAKINASGIPTSAGPVSVNAKVRSVSNSNENASVFTEYPQPKSLPIETYSVWMNGEPTWATMQTLRLEKNLERYQAEFDYSSDMGVDGGVAAKVSEIGLSIGGKYEEMKRCKWVFDVEFWPRKSLIGRMLL